MNQLLKLAEIFCIYFLISDSFAAAATKEVWSIDQDLSKAEFWEADPMLLMSERAKLGFQFTSAEKRTADCREAGAVKCFGFEVYETVLKFGEVSGVEAVELSFYNQGGVERTVETEIEGKKWQKRVREDKELSREQFMKIGAEVSAALTAPGAKAPKATDGAMRTATMTVKEKEWKKPTIGGNAKLSWSYKQKGNNLASFKPGYIKLVITHPSVAGIRAPTRTAAPQAKGAKKIVENILKDSRGTFLDNIPMVDQGMKGYCAAATSERVLKYYGIEVDEHEIAQAAGTSAENGTSTLAMKDAVTKIGQRYRLGTVVAYGDFEQSSEARIAGLNQEVENYNKAAKKLKAKPITGDRYIKQEGATTYYDIAAVDKAMEPRVLVEMKTKGAQASRYKKFLKSVHEQIDKGIPLFWGVKLGVAPETGIPQTMGYHMRLIIGYNDKKNEIINSDSWGAGHEFKKMRADWAWTITRSLLYLKPLSAR